MGPVLRSDTFSSVLARYDRECDPGDTLVPRAYRHRFERAEAPISLGGPQARVPSPDQPIFSAPPLPRTEAPHGLRRSLRVEPLSFARNPLHPSSLPHPPNSGLVRDAASSTSCARIELKDGSDAHEATSENQKAPHVRDLILTRQRSAPRVPGGYFHTIYFFTCFHARVKRVRIISWIVSLSIITETGFPSKLERATLFFPYKTISPWHG